MTKAEDIEFKEWLECRGAIARFDGYLKDLRVYGFTIITTLLGASAFFGFTGSEPEDGDPIRLSARIAVIVVIMLLVAALLYLDTYYEVLISGAVERALDLEAATDQPKVRLTKYLAVNSYQFQGKLLRDFAYGIFYLIPVGLGATVLLSESAEGLRGLIRPFFAVVALALGLLMVVARQDSRRKGNPDQWKQRTWVGDKGAMDKTP